MAVTPPEERILVERLDPKGIALITINRPEALNALTKDMLAQMAAAFRSLCQDPSVRVIILTGAGRAFSAGIDLSAAQAVFKGDVKNYDDDPVAQMERCPVPIIGAINGVAVTAGFEIALACDILVASFTARFMDTHARFGLMPSWGLSQKLPRLIGANRARELSFTAQPLDAKTAAEWGLVSRAVAPEKLREEAMRIASAILGNRPNLVRQYKAVLRDGLDCGLSTGLRLEKDRAHAYYANMPVSDFETMSKFIAGRSSRNSPGAGKSPQSKL